MNVYSSRLNSTYRNNACQKLQYAIKLKELASTKLKNAVQQLKGNDLH